MNPPANNQSSEIRYSYGVALVLLAGVCFSIQGLVVRLTIEANAWQILLYRAIGTLLFLLSYLGLQYGRSLRASFLKVGLNGFFAGVFIALSMICFITSLKLTTVANAQIINAAAPFLTAVLALYFLKEAVSRATWLTMAVAIAGLCLMAGYDFGSGRMIGNIFAFLAMLFYAFFVVVLRRGKDIDMTPTVCIAAAIVMVVSSLVLLYSGSSLSIPPLDIYLCTSLGVIQIGIGSILYIGGARHLAAAEITLLGLLETLLGPFWVWIGVGETPTVATLAGGALVLSAVVARTLAGVKIRRPPPHVA